MPVVPHARAAALPTEEHDLLPPSPLRRLRAVAAERGDDVAVVVGAGSGTRTWSEVAQTVEQAAAGLVRSGMRADQVVLSLLAPAHDHPELDLALRAIGTVVVHVSPGAANDLLVRELHDVDVRLVLAEDSSQLERLAGLQFRAAEMFEVSTGWARLLTLGAERLRMDPDVVTRVDRVVDPAGAAARVLAVPDGLVRVPPEAATFALGPDEITLLVGDHAQPLVHHVRDLHLASGGVLQHVADVAGLVDVLAGQRPTTLVVGADVVDDLAAQAPVPSPEPRRRLGRSRTPDLAPLRAWFGGRLERLVADRLPRDLAQALRNAGIDVVDAELGGVLPADLPVPPPVVRGDVADLPRRSRQEPGTEFRLRTDVSLQPEGAEASAFVLPSLPLFGGESFLDKLLIAQAEKARA